MWAQLTSPCGMTMTINHIAGTVAPVTKTATYGTYWSSTQDDTTYGWYLDFYFSGSNMYSNYKTFGFSVSCLREI